MRIPNMYLDQIDERNQVEKAQFRDVFTDYMDLMNDMKDVTDKMKVIERENYTLRQSGDRGGTVFQSQSFDDTASSTMNVAERLNFENQIKALEKQLIKAQEGKMANTDSILEMT